MLDPFNESDKVPYMKPSPDRPPTASICEAHRENTGAASLDRMERKKFPNPGNLGVRGDGTGKSGG